MADLPNVVRLPRVDPPKHGNDYILLHVSSKGVHPFDLKLIGTEGEAVFSAIGEFLICRETHGPQFHALSCRLTKPAVNHDETSSLRHANNRGTHEEFDNILSAVLLGTERDEFTQGIEAVGKTNRKSMTIHIQKNIQGITVRHIKSFYTAELMSASNGSGRLP
jgi:hypothetical protein